MPRSVSPSHQALAAASARERISRGRGERILRGAERPGVVRLHEVQGREAGLERAGPEALRVLHADERGVEVPGDDQRLREGRVGEREARIAADRLFEGHDGRVPAAQRLEVTRAEEEPLGAVRRELEASRPGEPQPLERPLSIVPLVQQGVVGREPEPEVREHHRGFAGDGVEEARARRRVRLPAPERAQAHRVVRELPRREVERRVPRPRARGRMRDHHGVHGRDDPDAELVLRIEPGAVRKIGLIVPDRGAGRGVVDPEHDPRPARGGPHRAVEDEPSAERATDLARRAADEVRPAARGGRDHGEPAPPREERGEVVREAGGERPGARGIVERSEREDRDRRALEHLFDPRDPRFVAEEGRDRLGPVRDLEVREDRRDVDPHRPGSDPEHVRDLVVRQPLREPLEEFAASRRERRDGAGGRVVRRGGHRIEGGSDRVCEATTTSLRALRRFPDAARRPRGRDRRRRSLQGDRRSARTRDRRRRAPPRRPAPRAGRWTPRTTPTSSRASSGARRERATSRRRLDSTNRCPDRRPTRSRIGALRRRPNTERAGVSSD